jgi:hypothetical protein
MKSKQQIINEILYEVAHCRTRVMDDCEIELGSSPGWKFFRSRLLKIFGERGLEGKISEIVNSIEAAQ